MPHTKRSVHQLFPLYDPSREHDACGIGLLADAAARPRRDIVTRGLVALERVTHRGAPAALGTVDGCGVMTAIPWALLAAELGVDAQADRQAVGVFFVPRGTIRQAATAVTETLRLAGASSIAWREVPTDPAHLTGDLAATAPGVHQVLITFGRQADVTVARLRALRLAVEAAIGRAGIDGFTVVSLSASTIVYKGLVVPAALPRFYPDLADARFVSPFLLFHQRFSTNTSADWSMAQPFGLIAHNGEINTIAGNRVWMRARLADRSSLGGMPPSAFRASGSDSQSLDDAIALMRAGGCSLPHAVARLLPPAWQRDRALDPDVRAFYEFQSMMSEPWEGPVALVFCDGAVAGAAVDRNGFRPARTLRTTDNLVMVASEAGLLDVDDATVVERGRLGPGEMLAVDLVRRRVLTNADLRRGLARQMPYRRMVDRTLLRPSAPLVAARGQAAALPAGELGRQQVLFGYSREEIDLILRPMAAEGHEAVGSMGDDTPPAALSSKERLLPDFFRQRFAQVTNPPIDPYREASVMSLQTLLGAHGHYLDEAAARPKRVAISSPVLSAEQLHAIVEIPDLRAATLDLRVGIAQAHGFAGAIDAIAEAACRLVRNGAALVVLTDRRVDAAWVPLPPLAVVSAVHQRLIAEGLRMRASLVVDSGEARDPHHVAALCAYGASAVCAWLAYQTVAALALPDGTGRQGGTGRYRVALERGVLRILSKMGVCTAPAYMGAQLFDTLGLDGALVDRYFPGTAAPIGGLTLGDVARHTLARHQRAFAPAQPALDYPGLHTYRRDGEYHAANPLVVRKLHQARSGGRDAYEALTSLIYSRPPAALRDLLRFGDRAPVPLDRVEPAAAIARRFFASAMSVGALAPEAHRTIAVAMNRLGARGNSGEGGEEPDRFVRPSVGDWDGNRTKQIASARFGVTPAYLRSADEIQIKIAQGSKPGEGGQLPSVKVVPHIARLRHAQPGTTLISPPVHHDIYSIEDLAQLVYDLRTLNPQARINVKLVAGSGVGIIASGVVKAGADAIQISGHDGGTGASPRGSIKHAGLPWEIGVAEANQVLLHHGLRHRVVLQTDGGLKTGRDVAVAAALGAEEYGFGTAALVALGCVMARQCHLNSCPVGIATQRADLRAKFAGTPEMLVAYLTHIAEEVRSILAGLGLRRLDELVGRSDLLRPRTDIDRAERFDLAPLLAAPPRRPAAAAAVVPTGARHPLDAPLSARQVATASAGRHRSVAGTIANTDRTFGAAIAGSIAAAAGDRGLADGALRITLSGSAGQSFGAFALPGMRLTLVGEANDYVGKGMHGGEIIVRPRGRHRTRHDQVLVGNTALYGATGGRLFVAGRAGERFAVRNSGATAVVEGVGDHACEYMTGGLVLVLGPAGRNFAAGMSGGVVYVHDPAATVAGCCNAEMVSVYAVAAADRQRIRELLVEHLRFTGSRAARTLLGAGDEALSTFRKVIPTPPALAEADPGAEDEGPTLVAAV